jgi:hypothetical protein
MNIVKRVAVIAASPKTTGSSVSGFLAAHAGDIMKDSSLDIRIFSVRESLTKKQTTEAYAYMDGADALLIIFPLYIFCMPGILTHFLQDYHDYLKALSGYGAKPFVYTVVNCGFPEPEINEEAVRVIGSFSRRIGAQFRFGVMIGGGGMVLGAQGSPMVKKMTADIDGAFVRMKEEILTGSPGSSENILTSAKFPRRLYYFAAGIGWNSSARENGLKKKDLYAMPYR